MTHMIYEGWMLQYILHLAVSINIIYHYLLFLLLFSKWATLSSPFFNVASSSAIIKKKFLTNASFKYDNICDFI